MLHRKRVGPGRCSVLAWHQSRVMGEKRVIGIVRRMFAAVAATCFAASASGQGVLPEGAQWEKVSSAGKAFAEGVVAAPDGALYLVDLAPPGTLFRHDPRTNETTVVANPSNMANGLHIDRDGSLLICKSMPGATGIAKRNLATGVETMLVQTFEGKPLIAPNDLTIDAQGRIYFTDARFNQAAEPALPNAVYRLDPDGKLTQLATDVGRPNGIEVSPDGRRLYVSASIAARLRPNPLGPAADRFGITKGGVAVYDLAADGSISNGRLFYKTEVAMADGMAMDTDGNLYIAFHDNPNRLVIALDPTGKVIQEFPLPETGLTTQLGFGRGDDAGSLYLTTGGPWALYRIRTTRKGFYRF
jgi:gluconolactonase